MHCEFKFVGGHVRRYILFEQNLATLSSLYKTHPEIRLQHEAEAV